ncbi:hypothetical protein AGDE_10763 [Angomonas deanei]|uniref:Uncharacterized protein n=1 Tax=Angomonas deanei TaxID=59799 RepID=A0A7G2CAH8_9TRYP|nr:hypothetical protein AGDE_10763 [Angomonas deanei]CAD2216786.1 hypothetical protein, conserved [Angomonas deanei]|eukprot:EPY27443.1 hypothetical protein AGDE_10763 [Angomonas deanei]
MSSEANKPAQDNCILGDCSLRLTHSSPYEPPLYLFPELVARVPENSPPAQIWDSIADSINIEESYWRIANATSLKGIEHGSSGDNTTQSTGKQNTTVTTLAGLVSSNKLLSAGLSANVLQEGTFSAKSIVESIVAFGKRENLEEKEMAALLSNHFVNLLAWKKLRELNEGGAEVDASAGEETATDESTNRKRPREELPSPDPWTLTTDSKFIATGEENVEERVKLLQSLKKLYGKWTSLSSSAAQTDYVVPPGTINPTSPYAEKPFAANSKSEYHPVKDLGWTRGKNVKDEEHCFSVLIQTKQGDGLPTKIVLSQQSTNFGRTKGVQSAMCGSVLVHAGLEGFTAAPEFITFHHFSLVLRAKKHIDVTEEGPSVGNQSVWLVNYGANGVHVVAPGETVCAGYSAGADAWLRD